MFQCFVKIELVTDETRYSAKEISKKIYEGIALFLLPANGKMREKRNHLKMELLSKKEPELKYLENSQLAKFLKIQKRT